jgi:Rps23 Pro-64 3,4-dihydroxylase Tpa1-like proline 4-hydroxylase
MTVVNFPNTLLSGRIDDLAGNLVLLERMEAVLEQRLQAKLGDEVVLFQLANGKRKQGKLEEALRLYAELAERYPRNTTYPYTIAALTGELSGLVGDEIKRPCVCPVLEWENFLPEQTIQDMIDYMCEHQADFRQALVGDGKGRYDPDTRNNTDLSLKGNPVKEQVCELITERLPEMTRRLGLSPFEASRIEVKLRAYHDGEYFRVHQDGGRGRQISYTYFFHPEPKRFEGGEFVAFDTDVSNSSFNHSFTRIMPKRNSAFFFPSHFYHAVLPVEASDNDFMSARFVINGHIWEKQSTDNATANPI